MPIHWLFRLLPTATDKLSTDLEKPCDYQILQCRTMRFFQVFFTLCSEELPITSYHLFNNQTVTYILFSICTCLNCPLSLVSSFTTAKHTNNMNERIMCENLILVAPLWQIVQNGDIKKSSSHFWYWRESVFHHHCGNATAVIRITGYVQCHSSTKRSSKQQYLLLIYVRSTKDVIKGCASILINTYV